MDPGMIVHDPELGWALSPHWSGQHSHRDFIATYTMEASGARMDASGTSADHAGHTVLVLGDSFTFGIGVGDDQTFTALLKRMDPLARSFVNAAVPGYSTDQEVLAMPRWGKLLEAQEVLVVVYLGNDILDNPRSQPIQAAYAKPYFTLVGGTLELLNQPVPVRSGTGRPPPAALAVALFGDDRSAWPLRLRLQERSRLAELIAQPWIPDPPLQAPTLAKLDSALLLFERIINRANDTCQTTGAKLRLVLLAGKSYFVRQDSVSAQHQEYCRKAIVASCARAGIDVIDVATGLRDQTSDDADAWFFRHDGHLTPKGHQQVAQLVLAGLVAIN